ncbi:MAG: SBBP repeat-containing protein, partial [Pyrinomonadaceae bacterium]
MAALRIGGTVMTDSSIRFFVRSHRVFVLVGAVFCFALFGVGLWASKSGNADREKVLLPPQIDAAKITGAASDTTENLPRANFDFGKIPLSFEINEGQTAASVRFLSRGTDYTLFLTPTNAVFSLQPQSNQSQNSSIEGVVRMNLIGANGAAKSEAVDQLPGKSNYFVGNDPRKWRVDVPTFEKVNFYEVYKGIDLVYYGNQRQLEYDFVVAPNADAAQIRWSVAADKAEINETGGLALQAGGRDVLMKKPVAYQTINGERKDVSASYVLVKDQRSKIQNQEVSFTLGEYDHTAELVIDPVVVFSSALLDGSGSDSANSITLDPSGNAYVTGNTASANFPTVNAIQTTLSGGQDAFVSKFNAAGTALIYSTFLGGNTGFENGWDISVDASGNAYVTGQTTAPDFPVTPSALQPTRPTGNSQDTAFVTRLSPTGMLFYSTYLSGTQSSQGFGIGTDGAGNAYVTGRSGFGFPVTASAFSSTNFGSGFLTKLNTNASGAASLVYSTFLGPTGFAEGRAIAVD